MKSPKIALTLFPSKTLIDGTNPILVRITYDRIRKYVSTGCSAKKEDWDYELEQMITKKDGKRLNKAIDVNKQINRKLAEIERECLSMGERFQLHKIGSKITKTDDLSKYMQSVIESLLSDDKPGNAVVYRTTFNSLMQFDSNLRFSKIDSKFLDRYAKHLNQKGLSQSAQNNYIRTLRAVFNRAIAEEVIDENIYPFSRRNGESGKFKVSSLSVKASPIGLSIEQMLTLKSCEVSEKDGSAEAKRIFLLSYFLRGMSFTDLARLKWNDIQNQRFNYIRKKLQNRQGAKSLNVSIPEKAAEILEYYTQFGGIYILNVLDGTEKTEKAMRQRIQGKLKIINAGLKIISKSNNLPEQLSSYWARHTYAKTLNSNSVPLSVIQQALGHAELSTTGIYIKSMNQEEVDATSNFL